MLDLGSAYARGEGTEGAVCGGMAVTADKGGAGQSEALLRADNVDDALTLVAETEICEAEVFYVFFESHALQTRVVLLNEGGNVLDALSGFGRDIVICGCEGAVGSPNLAAGILQSLEGLWGGDLVDQVAIWLQRDG